MHRVLHCNRSGRLQILENELRSFLHVISMQMECSISVQSSDPILSMVPSYHAHSPFSMVAAERIVCRSRRRPHLPGRTSDRAISIKSSRAAVGSSLFQATPSPILKSTPRTFFSSKPRFGRSCVHSGTKPMPSPAETSDSSEKVSSQV